MVSYDLDILFLLFLVMGICMCICEYLNGIRVYGD